MFNWLKRKKILEEKSKSSCSFGSVNILTGETKRGYISKDGLMEFKTLDNSSKTDKQWVEDLNKAAERFKELAWSEPVFVCIIHLYQDLYYSGWFKPTTVHRNNESVSLYKRSNCVTKVNEYFYYREGLKRYIDADAFEKCNNTVVLLNEET